MSEDPSIGWQAGPTRRGSLGILFNCLLTVVACTWSVQHLNVPAPSDGTWTRLLRKAKWAAITVLFPEFIMAHAVYELIMAVDGLKDFENKGLHTSTPWWFPLAGNGRWGWLWHQAKRFSRRIFCGCCHRTKSDIEAVCNDSVAPLAEEKPLEWTLSHSYMANMGGFSLRRERQSREACGTETTATKGVQSTTSPSSSRSYMPVTATKIAELWDDTRILETSEEDIKDKSKNDFFAKGIAVVQIAQLFLSIVVRWYRRLGFSQLETLTLAFSVCGVLTYAAYWYKPQGVETPIGIIIHTLSSNIDTNGDGDAHASDASFLRDLGVPTYDQFWEVLTNAQPVLPGNIFRKPQMLDRQPLQKTAEAPSKRVKNDNIPQTRPGETHSAVFLLAVLTAGFGAIHAISWRSAFPTDTERLLWWIATSISTAAPPLTLLLIPLVQLSRPFGDPREFMRSCMHVLREFSLSAEEVDFPCPPFAARDQAEAARRALVLLEDAYNHSPGTPCRTHYRDIFVEADGDLLPCLVLFLLNRDRDSQKLTAQLYGLYWHLYGGGSRKIRRDATVDAYPMTPMLSPLANQIIVGLMGILYILARLCIIGLAFSCLRWMPDSVYVETWAKDIPSIQ